MPQVVKHHKDGTVSARGSERDGQPFGYWEWFRIDGTIKRSGTFNEAGEPVGEWTTYDRAGEVYNVTQRD